MNQIAPPDVVVTDVKAVASKKPMKAWPAGSSGAPSAFKGTIKQATTIRPKLCSIEELYGLGKRPARERPSKRWIDTYLDWCKRWEASQKTKRDDGGERPRTKERLVRAH